MQARAIVKADKNSEASVLPDEGLLTEMLECEEELVKAGAMLADDLPSWNGKSVRFSGRKRILIDGPFAETKS
jgi:hypothetical protein